MGTRPMSPATTNFFIMEFFDMMLFAHRAFFAEQKYLRRSRLPIPLQSVRFSRQGITSIKYDSTMPFVKSNWHCEPELSENGAFEIGKPFLVKDTTLHRGEQSRPCFLHGEYSQSSEKRPLAYIVLPFLLTLKS